MKKCREKLKVIGSGGSRTANGHASWKGKDSKGRVIFGRTPILETEGLISKSSIRGASIAPEQDGRPELVMCFLPKADYQLDDQWRGVGMQGTDSNTIVVEDAFVPHPRVFWLERSQRTGESPGHKLNPTPLYRLPFIPTLGLALVPAAPRGQHRASPSGGKSAIAML